MIENKFQAIEKYRVLHSAKGGTCVKVGLDVGSTTIKCVVLDSQEHIIYSAYERHNSHIIEKTEEFLRRVSEEA